MRKFEEFTRPAPRVAINTSGHISFNSTAFQGLGNPKAVILLFDKASQAVGLKPRSDKVRHAYPVRRPYNSESYIIRAKAFLKYYDIDASRTLAFKPQVEDGVLIFELSKGVSVMRRGVSYLTGHRL